jgi:hypothetical protein
MSATQTSTSTDIRKLIPVTRAWATASQATHSARMPPTTRTARGTRCQPATPPRSKKAPASTQAAPAAIQTMGSGRSSHPMYQESAHSARQTSAMAMEPDWRKPFSRPHSQAPAAISTRVTTAKGVGVGQNRAGSKIASRAMAVMTLCLSIWPLSGCAPGGGRAGNLLGGFAEAPLALPIFGDGRV